MRVPMTFTVYFSTGNFDVNCFKIVDDGGLSISAANGALDRK